MCLRFTSDAPWFASNSEIFETLGHTPVTMVMKERAREFLTELENYPNEYLRMILDYDLRFINMYKSPRNQLILNEQENNDEQHPRIQV